MKKIFVTSFILFVAVMAFGQPVLRTFFTTNGTTTVFANVTNVAIGTIAADVTKQAASAALTNLVAGIGTGLTNVQPISANLFLLSTNNGANLTNFPANLQSLYTNNAASLTNVQPSGIAGPKFTGIITNISTLSTNIEFFSFGILTNATRNP